MMKKHLIHNLSLKSKVFVSIISCVILSIFVISVGFTFFNVNIMKESFVDELLSVTKITSNRTAASIEFNDYEEVEKHLEEFSIIESIELSCVYNMQNNLIARYSKNKSSNDKCSQHPSQKKISFNDSLITLQEKIFNIDSEEIGKILVKANTLKLQNNIISYIYNIIFSLFIVSILIGLILKIFQKFISSPINNLEKAASEIAKGGKYEPINIHPYNDEVGALSKSFNSMISEIKKRDHQLNEINKELENKVIARTADLEKELANRKDFTACVSHEIRMPVSAMHNTAVLLCEMWDEFEEKDRKKFISQQGEAIHRLISLVNTIVDFSSLERGVMGFKMVKSDLTSICESSMKTIEEACRNSDKDLIFKMIKPQISTKIVLDGDRVGQVVRNIVTNAAKYSPSGKVTLRISKVKYRRKEALQVSISDEGVGIPDDELTKIFGFFTQSTRTNDHTGGVGLGLSISKEIITAHRGKIWAENNKTIGATFHFVIPKGLEEREFELKNKDN